METQQKKRGTELSRKELIKNLKEDLWVVPQNLLIDLRQFRKELIWGYGFTAPGSTLQNPCFHGNLSQGL